MSDTLGNVSGVKRSFSEVAMVGPIGNSSQQWADEVVLHPAGSEPQGVGRGAQPAVDSPLKALVCPTAHVHNDSDGETPVVSEWDPSWTEDA